MPLGRPFGLPDTPRGNDRPRGRAIDAPFVHARRPSLGVSQTRVNLEGP